MVVKQRDKVARAVTAEYEWTRDTLVTHVVDPVGAGDTRPSGYLSAWLRGDSPGETLLASTVSAALAVGTRKDFDGLPNRADPAHASAALSGSEEVHR